MRGALCTPDIKAAIDGLIPACAGSTHGHERAEDVNRAHPRLCGEHRCAMIISSQAAGSSPPVRGAHLLTWGNKTTRC